MPQRSGGVGRLNFGVIPSDISSDPPKGNKNLLVTCVKTPWLQTGIVTSPVLANSSHIYSRQIALPELNEGGGIKYGITGKFLLISLTPATYNRMSDVPKYTHYRLSEGPHCHRREYWRTFVKLWTPLYQTSRIPT